MEENPIIKELTERRKELYKSIERSRKEIVQIEATLNDEGILDDPTLIYSIEKALKAYEAGDFQAIKKHAQRMQEALEADRFYRVLTPEDFESYIDTVVSKPDSYLYEFPDSIGSHFKCPYGLPITIGAPPKGRKTSLSLNMVYFDTMRDVPSVFASFELTLEQVYLKILQIHLRKKFHVGFKLEVMPTIIRNGVQQFPDVQDEIRKFADKFFKLVQVVECSGYTVERLCSTIDRVASVNKARVIHIDYFQRIRNRSEDVRVGYMRNSRILTEKCKQMNAIFVILSQMNNEGGYKETGALEEDAGLAIVLTKDSSGTSITLNIKAARFMKQMEYTLNICDSTGAIL